MSFRTLTFNFEIVLKTMMTLFFKICNFIPFVSLASKLSIFYVKQFEKNAVHVRGKTKFLSVFNLSFWKKRWHFFAKFAASEHSIFYVRQFEKNAVHVRGKVCQRLMKNVSFPRFFFRRRCRLVHVEYARQPLCTTAPYTYIRTYLFRRFPALNSIHPFWPTRLWEMISAVVPLNFLFLALLRIYTYDILLHRRFLHFLWFSRDLRK